MNPEILISIIWVVFIAFFISRIVKKSKETTPFPKKLQSQQILTESVYRRAGIKGTLALKDDRGNDWMAKQLREEHVAFKKTSDMFNLKIEHASSCDAQMLAQFHASHCDAHEVDTAQA